MAKNGVPKGGVGGQADRPPFQVQGGPKKGGGGTPPLPPLPGEKGVTHLQFSL